MAKSLTFSLIIFGAITSASWAQESSNPLAPGYYIVVAAYRLGQDSYAQNYMQRINKEGIQSRYGADLGRKYLYVYLDYYTDFDQSIKEMLNTRKKTGFEKAWVRIMKEQITEQVNLLTQTNSAASSKETSPAPESKEEKEIVKQETEPAIAVVTPSVEEETVEAEVEEKDEPISEPKPLSESSLFLSLYNATNHRQVEGEIEVIDTDRARLMVKVKGNEQVRLPDPKNNSGRITLLANVFGYRPLQHEINYLNTPADTLQTFIEWAGNHYLVKFDMVRYHKGDINTLFNVYFFNDAAIMLPESKYQLNSLLEMMNENVNYKIKLHGHTNGNARGKIITMGPSESFFSLAGDVREGSGSAKELSGKRAGVIREWLIAQGIAADRISVKAWGGGRMLHDKHSANAKKNVRVDVEIISE